MIPILTGYALWLPAIVGLGTTLLLLWPVERNDSDPSHLLLLTIAGFATLSCVATVLNFFTPLSPEVDLVLLVCGWALFLIRIRTAARLIFSAWPGSKLSFLLTLVAVLLWSAYVSVKLPLPYDTGLYHLQVIKWTTQAQLPLGLANLHGRFGFNSTWFSTAAALEIPGFQGRSSFLIGSLLFAMYGVAAAAATLSVVRRGFEKSSLFLALSGGMWLWHARWEFVGSPSPEVPVLILGIVSVYASIRALESYKHSAQYVFISFAVALFSVVVKFSGAPILLAPLASAAWLIFAGRITWKGSSSEGGILLLKSCIIGVVLVVPCVVRGIALSGYLAYPVTWGRLDFLPWVVRQGQAAVETAWIMSWARHPGAQPDVVLANWNWLPEWFDGFRSNETVALIVRTGASGVLLAIIAGKKRLAANSPKAYLIPEAVSLVGVAFWFLTAPDLRFGLASLWSLALISLSIGLWRLHQASQLFESRFSRACLVWGLLGVLAIYSISARADSEFDLANLAQKELVNWPKIQSTKVIAKPTTEGIDIVVPESSKVDQCWAAALPCTPYWADLVIEKDEAGHVRSFRVRQ